MLELLPEFVALDEGIGVVCVDPSEKVIMKLFPEVTTELTLIPVGPVAPVAPTEPDFNAYHVPPSL